MSLNCSHPRTLVVFPNNVLVKPRILLLFLSFFVKKSILLLWLLHQFPVIISTPFCFLDGITLMSIFSIGLFKFRWHDEYLCKISHHMMENMIFQDVNSESRTWGECYRCKVLFCIKFHFRPFLRKEQLSVTTFVMESWGFLWVWFGFWFNMHFI